MTKETSDSIPNDIKSTAWLEQYREFKSQYQDALLLFRMGDFYELFFDDARIAASVLDIALTARDREKKIPMAGVPYHALNTYLARLVKAGFRAAICEQIGEVPARGIVERRVVRVVTPGTFVPEDSDVGGRLAAVVPLPDGRIAAAMLSAETGRLEAGTLTERDVSSLLSAFAPGEVLYPSNVKESALPDFLRHCQLRQAPRECFSPSIGAERLSSALGGVRLESFGIADGDPCTGPAWAVLDYLSSTQFSSVKHVLRVWPLLSGGRMYIDSAAQASLELLPETSQGSSSLLSNIDKCRTPMGRRLLREWITRPLTDCAAVSRRQDGIDALMSEPSLLSRLQDILSGVRDMERALSRIAIGTGTPRDLASLRTTLGILPDIVSMKFPEPVAALMRSFPDMSELFKYLSEAVEDEPARAVGQGPVIRSSFSEELASWRAVSEKGEAWLDEYLERERAASNTPKLKAGYNRAFGYYLEVGRTGLAVMPPNFERRQTLVNAERFVTPELREFQDKMERSEDETARIEAELLNAVMERTLSFGADIQFANRLLGTLDCAASCAALARERGYVRPIVNDSDGLVIRGGRHPVLEASLTDAAFVPNDAVIGGDSARVIILTGPNMAGKSTYLRMTALLAIMAQAGMCIPADSAEIGVIDRVFTRIGAHDDISRGNSTFMIEMLETANILNNITPKSLVILDEIGRGTAAWDGMSIAWAVLEHLHSQAGARILFATHCHELTCLEGRLDGVKNLSMAVAEGDDGVEFMHHVTEGPAGRSYGIEVARLAGLPQAVLRRAFELLEIFEREGFERSKIPEPLPQEALKRQLLLFSPESDAIVEELASLDMENMTPRRALEVLYKLKDKAANIA